MAGTWLDSTPGNNYKPVKHVGAYEMGVQYRLGGTALERPVTDNPFGISTGQPQAVMWSAGWTAANDGTIDESSSYRGQTAPA